MFACAESAEAAACHLGELCGLAAGRGASGGGAGGPQLGLGDVTLLCLTAYCLLPDLQPARWVNAVEHAPACLPASQPGILPPPASCSAGSCLPG